MSHDSVSNPLYIHSLYCLCYKSASYVHIASTSLVLTPMLWVMCAKFVVHVNESIFISLFDIKNIQTLNFNICFTPNNSSNFLSLHMDGMLYSQCICICTNKYISESSSNGKIPRKGT